MYMLSSPACCTSIVGHMISNYIVLGNYSNRYSVQYIYVYIIFTLTTSQLEYLGSTLAAAALRIADVKRFCC